MVITANEYESITETDNESEIKIYIKEGIQKLLLITNKGIELEDAAITELGRLIFILFEELVTICAPLTSKDIEDYVSRAYPPEIFKECKKRGQAVYNKLAKKRGTISRRMTDGLKLKFPVDTIFNLSKKEWEHRGIDVKYNLIVYMLAMLEHITSSVLGDASALAQKLAKKSDSTAKPVITIRHLSIARNYDEELRKLFEEERRGAVVKPSLRTEPAQTYEEAVRRFMSDQANYIRDLQIIVNKIMPIFAKKESGLSEDMVDIIFGNVKDILLFELIFQNDLEEAKEMIREDSSFHVGVVFVEKALAEDYYVYAYYANNYHEAYPRFLELLTPEFCTFLQNEAINIGFTEPVVDMIIPRLMDTLVKEPLYHLIHIYQTVEDLFEFMTQPGVNSLEDRKHEVEYLKQTIENFERLSDIMKKVEQEVLTNSRDNVPHLSPRKAGVLRTYSAFEKIENFGESYQAFSQICSEHILNGNLYTVSEKGEQKLKHCYLFDGMFLVCARDVNAKSTNLRTIFKEKHLMKDLTKIVDQGVDSAMFDLHFRDVVLKLQAKNVRHKFEWVAAMLVLVARKVCFQTLEQKETIDLDFYKILPTSYKFTEPDLESNIRFVDSKAKSYTAIQTIAQGTLLKLVERVTYHKYTDLALVKQFLTTFRFFAKPRTILDLLIERYNIVIPGDLLDNNEDIDKIEKLKRLQKEYIKPVQLRVINVMRHWIDYHFDDFEKETELVGIMMGFFVTCKSEQTTMIKWITPLERTITRKQEHQQRRRGDSVVGSTDPVVWHLTEQSDEFSLFTLHPLEIARQVTLIENEFYRSVTPQELLGSHEEKQGGNMAKMINFSERFVFWIRQSIVETRNFEERQYVAARVTELMEYLESMNNYTGVFEIYSALKSAEVNRLDHTVRKLFKDKEVLLNKVGDWPAKNFKSYKEELKNCDPPCIPFIGIYKTKIMHTQDGNKDHKDNMINLSKFRMIADIISEIKLYQNEKYNFMEERSIQEFLRSLDPFRGRSSDKLQEELYNLSLEIEPKGAPQPRHYPRQCKDQNLAVLPPKVKRTGSLINDRKGKGDSTRRHRDSSVSDTSDMGLRTPGSRNTISPGSTRSPKEFFGYKFAAGSRSGTSDHDSPECSPLLPPSTGETSDECTEQSPRTLPRTDSTEESPKPPLPARDPKPAAPVPPSRDPILPPAPPARKKSTISLKDKSSPSSPSDEGGEYLETILNTGPPPRPGQTPPPNVPKRSVSSTAITSTTSRLASIKERDSSGESLTDIHASSRFEEGVNIPGMVRQSSLPTPRGTAALQSPRTPRSLPSRGSKGPVRDPILPARDSRSSSTGSSPRTPTLGSSPTLSPRTPTLTPRVPSPRTSSNTSLPSPRTSSNTSLPSPRTSSNTSLPSPTSRSPGNSSKGLYSTIAVDPNQVGKKRPRPPPLTVPTSPAAPPPIPLKHRSGSGSFSTERTKPPPLPPKTRAAPPPVPPSPGIPSPVTPGVTPPPPLPPRRTSK